MKIDDLKKIRVCFNCGSLYLKGSSWCPYCFTNNKNAEKEKEWLKSLEPKLEELEAIRMKETREAMQGWKKNRK